jgi:hypothetical protein
MAEESSTTLPSLLCLHVYDPLPPVPAGAKEHGGGNAGPRRTRSRFVVIVAGIAEFWMVLYLLVVGVEVPLIIFPPKEQKINAQ